jgi:dTDP-4-dehydrorhamnose reductase
MPFSGTSKKTALIVGADGLLGRALADALPASGWNVITTTRRTGEMPDQNIFMDLSGDVAEWQPPSGVGAAFLCAAVTSLTACRENPGQSARVNVESTFLIAKKLAESGAFVIFPSTNLVFDGSAPRCHAEAPVQPQTEYGRQKSEAERRILGLERAAVVRFTKIVWPGMPLVCGWISDLKSGRVIRPFSDMVLSPIPLSLAVDVLVQVAEKKLAGVMQASGGRDISYADLARRIAARFGAPPELVQPVRTKDSGIQIEAAPAYTTLDTARLESELGIRAPDVWETIDSVFKL